MPVHALHPHPQHVQLSCLSCFFDDCMYLWQDVAEAGRKGGEQPGSARAVPITLHHLLLHACALDESSFVLPAASSAVSQAAIGALPAGLSPAAEDLAGAEKGCSASGRSYHAEGDSACAGGGIAC
jgi:hypothetical protein